MTKYTMYACDRCYKQLCPETDAGGELPRWKFILIKNLFDGKVEDEMLLCRRCSYSLGHFIKTEGMRHGD